MVQIASARPLVTYASTSHPSVTLILKTDSGGVGQVSLPLGYEDTIPRAKRPSIKDLVLIEVQEIVPRLFLNRRIVNQTEFDREIEESTQHIKEENLRSKVQYLLSAASAKACASDRRITLFEYLAETIDFPLNRALPVPMITLISGGKVATTEFEIQAVMAVPIGLSPLPTAIRACSEISEVLGKIYRSKNLSYAIGDEGGYSTNITGHDSQNILCSTIEMACQAIEEAGYKPGQDVELSIDFAAQYSQVGRNSYNLVTKYEQLSETDVVNLCELIANKFPIRFLEDPLVKSETDALVNLHDKLSGKALIAADDLLAINESPISSGSPWDAIIVMPDRLGTLSSTVEFVGKTRSAGYIPIASHRSGETEDVMLSDLAAALSIPFIKAGGMNRSDRMAKYNQLIRIAERFDSKSPNRRRSSRKKFQNEFAIESIYGREILDSRGRPTVEAEVMLAGGAIGRAAVPSGASTGSQEALELRDNDANRYNGRGVLTAVEHVNGEIQQAIAGRDAREQGKIDELLVKLDGSENSLKSRLGANAILAVSLALAHAASIQGQTSLYKYIRENLYTSVSDPGHFLLPVPMLNFINGGAHADNALDFQEFMLVPHGARNFEQAMEWASNVYLCLLREVRARGGITFTSYGVGDEGGFSITTPPGLPPRETVRFVLDLLKKFVKKAGYSFGRNGDFAIALDPAASEFYDDGYYVMGQRQNGREKIEHWDSDTLVSFYENLVEEYPIISIEDGIAETDENGWKDITNRLSDRCQLVGDDLFVTNPTIFQKGIDKGIANAILIKVNQIGTLTETLNVIKLAQSQQYHAIISHRSGETEDTTISDIAVAVNAGQIKTGCLSRADRAAKYNRLLQISNELGDSVFFDGRIATRSHSSNPRSR
jgi:enolase